jgi:hypothetical protein
VALNTITPPILYPLVTAKFSLPECVNVQVVMFQVNDEEDEMFHYLYYWYCLYFSS